MNALKFTHYESSSFSFSLLNICEAHTMCQALQVLTQQVKTQAPMEALWKTHLTLFEGQGGFLNGSYRESRDLRTIRHGRGQRKENSRQKDQQADRTTAENSSPFS